jgi:hypothetical protein
MPPSKTRGNPPKKPATKPGEALDPELSKRMEAPASGVTVRMYRTGLGDCFLLAFPKTQTQDDPRKVFYLLIDCGVFYGTTGGADRVKEIARYIKAATRKTDAPDAPSKIDVLVITHEHWDHVSGFHENQAQKTFESIELGTLWMAWTEDMTVPLARDLHAGKKAAVQALAGVASHAHLPATGSSSGIDLVHKALGFFAIGAGDGGLAAADVFGATEKKSPMTEVAMTWLREEYGKGKAEFLHPGGPAPLTLPGVPGARVYVLGPPEDPVLIRRSDPQGDEVYDKAMAAAVQAAFFVAFGVVSPGAGKIPTAEDAERAKEMSFPFERRYRIAREAAEADGDLAGRYYDADQEWRQIEGDWLEAAGEFALQLDNATNNTSLAFALELGEPGAGPVLLFPGDAQVGNWLSWFGKVTLGGQTCGKDMSWSVAGKTVTAADLLRRTVLYKVGHHGSHNATLRAQGLETMGGPNFVAMLPVDENVAQLKAGYGQMPLKSLIKDLLIRTGGRVMRNDEDVTPDPKLDPRIETLKGVLGAPALLEEFDGKRKNDLFIEYTVAP